MDPANVAEMALLHDVLSRETALVLVGDEAGGARPTITVQTPVALPSGWEVGTGAVTLASASTPDAVRSITGACEVLAHRALAAPEAFGLVGGAPEDILKALFRGRPGSARDRAAARYAVPAKPTKPRAADELRDLLANQRADGSFGKGDIESTLPPSAGSSISSPIPRRG